jgi:DNA-binding HxlR family transcriptional regulator
MVLVISTHFFVLYSQKSNHENVVLKTKKSQRNPNCHFGCPVEAALDGIGNKWKGIILFHLLSGLNRFNELKRLIPDVSKQVLAL